MKKKKETPLSVSQRAEAIMLALGKELPEVRDEIAKTFPSFNSLLNLHAKTFEEFALLPKARENGLPYEDLLFDYRQVLPPCPKCKEEWPVKKKGQGYYYCNNCKMKFTANYNSISSGFRLSSVVWRKVLHCMMEFYSLKRSCDYCSISPNTYYNIRNRIFYAMDLLMSEVKLYGKIQCDNTSVYLSYKGTKLQDEGYPEDSPFGDIELAPRKARNRGGAYRQSESKKNSINILAAIDEYKHVMVRMVGIGAASAQRLYNTVGSTKYLYTIPEKDPFDLFPAKQDIPEDCIGTVSKLISDGETAIKKYASKIGMDCESRVFRKDNIQLRLPKGANDIQAANSLHSRLKAYLRKLNYVSTKYLPGYLVMFEFIENTEASEEAIGRLFEILARPNLGKESDFYDDLFATPSMDADGAAETRKARKNQKGLPKNAVMAVQLYDLMIKEQDGSLSLPYISQAAGYTEDQIVEFYQQAQECGMLEIINKNGDEEENRTSSWTRGSVPADMLKYYDEFTQIRKQPLAEQIAFSSFVRDINIKHQKSYTAGMIKHYFKRIAALGLRPPLPEKKKRESIFDWSKEKQDEMIAMYDKCKSKYDSYRANNQKVSMEKVYAEIAEEQGVTVNAIRLRADRGRQLKNNATTVRKIIP